MESMNKFKVLTIFMICLFVFAIAAMYVNTKDASDMKANERNEYAQNEYQQEQRQVRQNRIDMTEVMYALDNLEHRVDDLSEKVDKGTSGNSGANSLNCRIYGVKTIRGIEELSQNAAIKDAQINKNDLVITCSL